MLLADSLFVIAIGFAFGFLILCRTKGQHRIDAGEGTAAWGIITIIIVSLLLLANRCDFLASR